MADTLSPATDADAGADRDGDAETLVRAPQQARSRKTLQRILDAGLRLLREEGPDALTVTGITRKARTSVGSFYARFEGKDDLLRYLGERALGQAEADWEAHRPERLDHTDRDLRAHVGAVVHRVGALYLEGPGGTLLLLDGIEDPPPTRRRRLEDRLATDLGSLLDAPALRVELATRVLTGILQDAALRGGNDATASQTDTYIVSPYPDPDILQAELVELLVGYLGGRVRDPAPTTAARDPDAQPEPAPSEPEPPEPEPEPDPFDVWS